jgi:hypothetical protein
VFLARLLEAILQVVLVVTWLPWFGTPNAFNPAIVELMDNFAPLLFALVVWAPLRWLPAALRRMPLLRLNISGGVLLGSRIDMNETGVKTF